jgi:hypothetical protein
MYTLYRITHKENNEYYIGYTKKEIGVNYFTSSKYCTFSKDTVNDWDIEIVMQDDSRDLVWQAEQNMIREHIEDPLCLNKIAHNLTATSFYPIATPETRAKISATTKARYEDPEERRKQSERLKKQRRTQYWRDRKSAESKAAHERGMVRDMKSTWEGPERREVYSERMQKRYQDPEERRKQSERMKAWWAERKRKKDEEKG